MLQSSPVVLLVSHRLNCFADIFSILCILFHHLSPYLLLMSPGLANAYTDSQKLGTTLREPRSVHCYYGSASVPKWPQKQSQSIWFLKISWGSMPPDPPSWLYNAYTSHTNVTPLAKILATGLFVHPSFHLYVYEKSLRTYWHTLRRLKKVETVVHTLYILVS